MSRIDDYVYVALLTSPAPWHPDTSRTLQVVESIWRLLGEQVFVRVYADGPPPWLSDAERNAYELYLRVLGSEQKLDMYRTDGNQWLGISGQMMRIYRACRKPLLMYNQDDLEYVGVERVAFPRLVDSMLSLRGPDWVRFCQVPIKKARHHVGRYIHDTEHIHGLPLTPTIAWVDGACIGTVTHYDRVMKFWNPKLDAVDGRGGAEGCVFRQLKREARQHGFAATQRQWGTYLYGSIGDEAYIRLVGNDRTEWRKAKGIYAPSV